MTNGLLQVKYGLQFPLNQSRRLSQELMTLNCSASPISIPVFLFRTRVKGESLRSNLGP